MKKMLILAALVFSSAASAQFHPLGVGVILGEPTGLSLKYFLNDKNAIDGAIGWSFHKEGDFHVHSDYLWHNYRLLSGIKEERLPVYFGIGGRFKGGDNDTRLGIRAPIGVAYMVETAPVEVFIEAGPVVDFTPRTRLEFTAAIGARFLF